jgi:hypothetical protein
MVRGGKAVRAARRGTGRWRGRWHADEASGIWEAIGIG